MEKVNLAKSDLTVSRLCMGGCPMGGYGWGAVDDQAMIETVRRALDMGVNFFDTADVYGLGHSERTLGRALGADRKRAIIATKFGVRVHPGAPSTYDNSPGWIRQALAESLRRLGTDYVDLYQIHYFDGVTPADDVVDALIRLREKGMIRYFGFSNADLSNIASYRPYARHFVSVQDEYSLARREHEADLVELAEQMSLTPMSWGSLGQGILTGKYAEADIAAFGPDDRRSRPAYVNFHGEKLKKNLQIVDVMRGVAQRLDKPIPAVAVRFILDNLPGSVVLAGMKTPAQLMSNLQAMDWRLDGESLRALREVSSGQ